MATSQLESLAAYVRDSPREPSEDSLSEWVKGLAAWGRVPLVVAATASVRCALEVWERAHPDAPQARECIEAAEAWMAKPEDAALAHRTWRLAFVLGDPDSTKLRGVRVPGAGWAEDEPRDAYWAASYAAAAVAVPPEVAPETAADAAVCAAFACGDMSRVQRAMDLALEAWLGSTPSTLGQWYRLPRVKPSAPIPKRPEPRTDPAPEVRRGEPNWNHPWAERMREGLKLVDRDITIPWKARIAEVAQLGAEAVPDGRFPTRFQRLAWSDAVILDGVLLPSLLTSPLRIGGKDWGFEYLFAPLDWISWVDLRDAAERFDEWAARLREPLGEPKYYVPAPNERVWPHRTYPCAGWDVGHVCVLLSFREGGEFSSSGDMFLELQMWQFESD